MNTYSFLARLLRADLTSGVEGNPPAHTGELR